MENHFSHNTYHTNADNKSLRLYHKDVYFPGNLMNLCRTTLSSLELNKIKLSQHVKEIIENNFDGESHEYTKDDVLGAIRVAKNKADTANIFEGGFKVLQQEDGKNKLRLEKIVVRVPLDKDIDISVVLAFRDGYCIVATAWLNEHNDNHTVGFKSDRYFKPKDFVEPTKDEPKKKKVIIVRKRKQENLVKHFEEIYNLSK